MGCCGEPVGPTDQTNRPVPDNTAAVNQQPAPHPSPYYGQGPQSSPSPPQNVYSPNGLQPLQPQPTWAPPPAMSQLHSFSGTPPPTMASPYQGSTTGYSTLPGQSLLHPNPAHALPQRGDTAPPTANPQIMPHSSPQSTVDEGKMSVSIDFGM